MTIFQVTWPHVRADHAVCVSQDALGEEAQGLTVISSNYLEVYMCEERWSDNEVAEFEPSDVAEFDPSAIDLCMLCFILLTRTKEP